MNGLGKVIISIFLLLFYYEYNHELTIAADKSDWESKFILFSLKLRR